MELPAETVNLLRLLEFAGERIRAEGFGEETAVKLELAVKEILVNIIGYAYPGKKRGH